MADEQEQPQSSSRFRLPRLFSHAPEAVHEVVPDVEMISGEPATPPSRDGAGSMVVGPFAGSVVGALTANRNKNSSKSEVRPTDNAEQNGGGSASLNALASQAVVAEISALRDTVEGLSEQITQVNNRETSLEKVFDTLHKELAGYKNDFLYEHLKPVVRPLLFLFDSLEQFDGEVALAETSMAASATASATASTAAAPDILTPGVVRENVQFFRDQLAEALQVCEVTIMETPSGAFNAKLHRAVDVMPVPFEYDGSIVRVVRSGWFLNGQLLRPAEVVVGKHRG